MNGQYDQTGRLTAKANGEAFFEWAISCCEDAPKLEFLHWDDTRRLVAPGESDRTNDLVAVFRDQGNTQRDVWLVGEIKAEPFPSILHVMGLYENVLGWEINPHSDPKGPEVVSLVINLSGQQNIRSKEPPWPRYGNRIAPMILDVADQDALGTLEKIERKELDLSISPLLALMTGGGSRDFIDRWKLLFKDVDPLTRARFLEAAVVLAEFTKFQVNWIKGTEDWVVRESQYIRGWMNEGVKEGTLKTMQVALLTVIRRLENPVSESIRQAIVGSNDIDVL